MNITMQHPDGKGSIEVPPCQTSNMQQKGWFIADPRPAPEPVTDTNEDPDNG